MSVPTFFPILRPRPGLKLQGRGVYLRPPRLEDYRAWSELRRTSRNFLERWEPTWLDDDLGRRAFRSRLGAYARELETGEAWPFFVFRKSDDALIGAVRLFHVRRGVSQSGTIGYWVGQSHARKGHMSDAVATVIRFAFEGIGLHRLEAACMPENAASASLLLKCGFSEEGYARAYLKINGEWRDHRLFGLVSRL
ncbi:MULTISPECIES: GNAT family N-acetyltransferase [unclassified Caulobacter]|uniref:GNAT family N-acetyltransferase n=1 Tax=unclassified Caulobacter TaxID=2648921 RepID=UPI000D3601B3|nr:MULTISPECIES: GNAT family protein [unclassified Caulobacter]PTS90768.1 30S ribosomal protein S5 alanine N-acetyltransferase [Caulobacter sp. HMWF009]PTT08891.1 30S ribosomal protein S5 alanine N-acetyltransferase [Caulobacter sp. HMWF025]